MSEQSLNSEKEAQDLFLEMSEAVRNLDHKTIDRLAAVEEIPEEPEVKDLTPTDKVEDKKEDEEPTEKPADEPADDKVDNSQEQNKSEPEDKKPEEESAEKADLDPKEAEIQELKAKLDQQNQLVHKLRSDAGRVPSLQRKLDELDRRLREMAVKPVDAATARENNRELTSRLAQIREVDPALADVLDQAFAEMRQDVTRLEQRLDPISSVVNQDREELILEREWNKLVDQVPNAKEVFEHPLWSEWKSGQSDRWKSLASSMYAEDVLVAMQKFSADMIQQYPHLATGQAAPAQPQAQVQEPEPTKAQPSAAALKVKEERERKLKTGAVDSSSKKMEVQQDLDEQALFRKFFNEERKKFER